MQCHENVLFVQNKTIPFETNNSSQMPLLSIVKDIIYNNNNNKIVRGEEEEGGEERRRGEGRSYFKLLQFLTTALPRLRVV
jgi:hypothetical protein